MSFESDILPHSEVVDLLRLTMLVYDYGKHFHMEQGEELEGFLSSIKEEDENSDKLKDLTPERKQVLIDLAKGSPHGSILAFISEPETDLQCGVTISHAKKRINVIFRGSESMSDWYYDLQITKKKLDDKYQSPNNNIYVHRGFYNQLMKNKSFDNILFQVQEALKEYPDYHIYITGHSLGGALCTLFGYLLSYEVISDITVVSFASPRVGYDDWKEAYDNKSNLSHYRVSNHRDIVTAAPMFGYKHVGNCIRLFDTEYKYYPQYSYNGWWEFSLFNCWRVSDHMADLYYERLIKNTW